MAIDVKSLPIDGLGLRALTYGNLRRRGFNTIGELVGQSKKTLLQSESITEEGLRDLSQCLADINLELQPDEAEWPLPCNLWVHENGLTYRDDRPDDELEPIDQLKRFQYQCRFLRLSQRTQLIFGASLGLVAPRISTTALAEQHHKSTNEIERILSDAHYHMRTRYEY